MTPPIVADPTFAELTTAELQRMRDRAWREAARCWSEYRAYARGITRPTAAERKGIEILFTAADEAERFWHLLKHAAESRPEGN